MKYRLTVIFLTSLLFASFSFNCLNYDALIRTEHERKITNNYHSKLVQKLHERISQYEN